MHALTIRRRRGQHCQPAPPSARRTAAARRTARDAGVTAWLRRVAAADAPHAVPPIARAAAAGAVARFVLAAGGRGRDGEPRCPQCGTCTDQGCRHSLPAGLHAELAQALEDQAGAWRAMRPVSITRYDDGPDATIVVDARIPAPAGRTWQRRAVAAQLEALMPPLRDALTGTRPAAGRHSAPDDGIVLAAPLAPLPEPVREWRPRPGVAGNVPVTWTEPAPAGPPPAELRDHVAEVLARPARSQIGAWVDEILARPGDRWPHLQREWQDSTGSFTAVAGP